jgi:hypothetical protein
MRVHAYFNDPTEAEDLEVRAGEQGIHGRLLGAASGGAWFAFAWNRGNVQVIPAGKRTLVRLYSHAILYGTFDADSVSLEP